MTEREKRKIFWTQYGEYWYLTNNFSSVCKYDYVDHGSVCKFLSFVFDNNLLGKKLEELIILYQLSRED